MKYIPRFFRIFSIIFVLFIASSCNFSGSNLQQNAHQGLNNLQQNTHQNQNGNSPAPTCVPNYVYSDVHREAQYQKVFVIAEDPNHSPNTETDTLNENTGGSFTISMDLKLGAPLLDVIVKGLVDAGIQASATVNFASGNQISVSVPPFEELVGKYGIFIQTASGHLHATNCPKNDYGTITVNAPLRAGWCTWFTSAVNPTNQDPCPEM